MRSKHRLLFPLLCFLLLGTTTLVAQDATVEIMRDDQIRFFAPTHSGQTGLFETVTADTLRRGNWSFGVYFNDWDLTAGEAREFAPPSAREYQDLSYDLYRLSASVGVGLTDHPAYYAPDHGGDTFFLKSNSPWAGIDKHARIFLYPKQPWQGFWFNVEIVLNGQFWRMRHADEDILVASNPVDARTTVNFKFIFGSPLHEGNWARLGGPDGRLLVRHLPNPIGHTARPALVNLIEQLLAFFQAEPVDLLKEPNCHFGNGGTVNHAGGTMRMGTSGPRVVDENLKLLSYDNLYVCDPSVYPFIPAANPSLTLVALALRLGDHLAAKF